MAIVSDVEPGTGCHFGGAFAPNPAPPPPLRLRLDFSPPTAMLVPAEPVPRASAADVVGWFSDDGLAPLAPAPGALRSLLADSEAVVCPVLDALPASLPISVVRREREGGRRYAYHRPGSERQFRALPPVSSLLLPAIPGRVRQAFVAPSGQRYVVADIDRCFPTLLATVARDRGLLEAVRRDLHQEAGDAMAPDLPADQRRRLGKRFNSALVGLVSPAGWHRKLREFDVAGSIDDARRMHDAWGSVRREDGSDHAASIMGVAS